MQTQLYCPDEARKALVRAAGTVNGIDFLEVLDDEAPQGSPPQQTLLVHCFLPVAGLSAANVRIEGGVRVRTIGVMWAHPANAVPGGLITQPERDYLEALPDATRVLAVRTDARGDFSTYVLRLVLSPAQPEQPPPGFDPILSSVAFSFKVDCPSEFDCLQERACPQPVLPAPPIDYLAKDYASFRRLMLDRLAVTMPGWQERNPADVGIALVELLAYSADYLSYYQDAVATEAYLGTARRRPSVRRHARLLDYVVHDGSNARAWVCFEVAPGSSADGATLPRGTRLLSRDAGAPPALPPEQETQVEAQNPTIFETMHDVALRSSRNVIAFYTWGDPNCCLPRGATRATLRGSATGLGLQQGDVLLFEEVLGPESGREVDADPRHRHVVRLAQPPVELQDPVTGETVLDVRWDAADALPFPLCLREFATGEGSVPGASIARGNVVLADHGRTFRGEELRPPEVPGGERPYRPFLQRTGLTHAMPYDHEAARLRPAAEATVVDVRRVVPAVTLRTDGEPWRPQRDLLNSDRFATEFVVEMEEDGRAALRFGDGTLGRRPAPGTRFTATCRTGNGRAGNIGAEALATVVTGLRGIERVRNPLPARGGADPDPLERVRLDAPQAFRRQERAVTEADYAAAAERHPEVQKAAATRRWTGSWHTMFITVDRRGGRPVDGGFETGLRAFLERFRLAGYDIEIDGPRFIPLEIVLTVCVAPGYYRSSVKQALLETFSNTELPDGRRGFFHPDNFTFGQPVFLSQITATAMQVPGVQWVDADDTPPKPNRFRRWGQPSRGEVAAGRLAVGRLEIIRVDSDPNTPENGKIDFVMQGGL